MVVEANSSISGEKKPEVTANNKEFEKDPGIAHGIAASLFYEANGVEKQFESLSAKEMKPWINKAMVVLAYIDKMDLALAKRVSTKEAEASRRRDVDALTKEIEDFVKGLKTTKPGLFPAAELAIRIVKL